MGGMGERGAGTRGGAVASGRRRGETRAREKTMGGGGETTVGGGRIRGREGIQGAGVAVIWCMNVHAWMLPFQLIISANFNIFAT